MRCNYNVRLVNESFFSMGDINEHYPIIWQLAKRSPRIVEMGMGDGLLTDVLIESGPETLWCCDHSYEERNQVAISRIQKKCQEKSIKFTFEQTDSRYMDFDESDLLIIDSYGAYAQVLPELRNSADSINKFIVIHNTSIYGDVSEWGGRPSLRQGINDFLSERPEWSMAIDYGHNNGLTVLKRNM